MEFGLHCSRVGVPLLAMPGFPDTPDDEPPRLNGRRQAELPTRSTIVEAGDGRAKTPKPLCPAIWQQLCCWRWREDDATENWLSVRRIQTRPSGWLRWPALLLFIVPRACRSGQSIAQLSSGGAVFALYPPIPALYPWWRVVDMQKHAEATCGGHWIPPEHRGLFIRKKTRVRLPSRADTCIPRTRPGEGRSSGLDSGQLLSVRDLRPCFCISLNDPDGASVSRWYLYLYLNHRHAMDPYTVETGLSTLGTCPGRSPTWELGGVHVRRDASMGRNPSAVPYFSTLPSGAFSLSASYSDRKPARPRPSRSLPLKIRDSRLLSAPFRLAPSTSPMGKL